MKSAALALLVVSAVGVTAAAKKPAAFTAISPIFSQLVAFSLPATFKTVFEDNSNGQYIREAVLAGETAEQWSQMITISGAEALAGQAGVTPESYSATIADGFKSACPETFAVKAFGPAPTGDPNAFAAIAQCGIVEEGGARRAETALIVAIKGEKDVYTLQWSERTAPSAENLTIDEAKWLARLDALKPIRLCALVPGEKAPYPSCLGGSP